jgi:putative ABC transport system substrate-binding protein
LKFGIQPIAVQSASELPRILSAAAGSQIDALSTTDDGIFVANAKTIAEIAIKNRTPSSGFKELVRAGGLISYGPDVPALFRRAAVFVAKILKGAKPGDIPIEQPTKFELVLNLKTAKAFGLEVPSSFYWRADEVIE